MKPLGNLFERKPAFAVQLNSAEAGDIINAAHSLRPHMIRQTTVDPVGSMSN